MNGYAEKLKLLVHKGLFHIMGTNIINYIIAFLTNIVVVRLMNKNNYGIYSYAYNQYAVFLIFSGMGILSGVLQFGAEQRPESEKLAFYKFGLVLGLFFNLLLSGSIFFYGSCGNISIPQSAQYVRQLALLPLIDYAYNFLLVLLRINKKNREYARLLNVNTILNFLGVCSGAYFYGISGAIIGKYLAFLISVFVGIYLCRPWIGQMPHTNRLQRLQKIQMIKYSLFCCLTFGISSLLYNIDIMVIGYTVSDPSLIASYKTATLIPTALAFIPNSVVLLLYPYFAQRNNDYDWIQKRFSELVKALLILNTVITALLIILAPFMIEIIWGKEYSDAVVPFRILALSYFVSATFRIPCINILASMRKVKLNFIISIVSVVSNVILDILFTRIWGIEGAAAATVIVFILASVIAWRCLMYELHTHGKGRVKAK